MRFAVKNSNIFPLPGNPHMLHLGTIGYGLREFIVMYCFKGSHKGKVFIEEAVLTSTDFCKDIFAHCKFIADDNLAEDLARFAEEKKMTDIKTLFETLIEQKKYQYLP